MKEKLSNGCFEACKMEYSEEDFYREEIIAELVKFTCRAKYVPRPKKVIRKVLRNCSANRVFYKDDKKTLSLMHEMVSELTKDFASLSPDERAMILEGAKFARGVSTGDDEYIGSFYSFLCTDGNGEEGMIIANTASDYWFVLNDEKIIVIPYQNETMKKLIDGHVKQNVLKKAS